VCEVDTHLSALELLYVCQAIETKQHRVREKKWGARTIDLDIITYGVQVIASKQLIVPHPEMMNRGFKLDKATTFTSCVLFNAINASLICCLGLLRFEPSPI
jgi:7,8-dihydro-6-hydroxymethylpterin-pyrophosphokinase